MLEYNCYPPKKQGPLILGSPQYKYGIARALLIQGVSTEGPILKGRTRSDKVIAMANVRRTRWACSRWGQWVSVSPETPPRPQITCLRTPGLQSHSELTSRLVSTRQEARVFKRRGPGNTSIFLPGTTTWKQPQLPTRPGNPGYKGEGNCAATWLGNAQFWTWTGTWSREEVEGCGPRTHTEAGVGLGECGGRGRAGLMAWAWVLKSPGWRENRNTAGPGRQKVWAP